MCMRERVQIFLAGLNSTHENLSNGTKILILAGEKVCNIVPYIFIENVGTIKKNGNGAVNKPKKV